MTAPVLPCDPDRVSGSLDAAAEVLHRGGLVAFPTETVYGLGAAALDAAAVGRIFAAKGRPAHNPVIVHAHSAEQVAGLVSAWPEAADRLAAAFWPGPLTLVLPRRPEIPDAVTAGGPAVAVRIPAHPVALALLARFGRPVAAPSANRSNRLSPTTAGHVLADLGDRIDLILDGGPCPGGIESTVVDLSSSPPRLLRPGLVDLMALERLLGRLDRPASPGSEGTPLPSPGMLARHYAPRTPLEYTLDATSRATELAGRGAKVALLTWRLPASLPPSVQVVPMPADPAGYAAVLYATLHRLDVGGYDRLVAEAPPDDDSWLAVCDRLRRASSREEPHAT